MKNNKKINKNNVIAFCGASLLAMYGIAGIVAVVYDESIDHTKQPCPFYDIFEKKASWFGVTAIEHQAKMEEKQANKILIIEK